MKKGGKLNRCGRACISKVVTLFKEEKTTTSDVHIEFKSPPKFQKFILNSSQDKNSD